MARLGAWIDSVFGCGLPTRSRQSKKASRPHQSTHAHAPPAHVSPQHVRGGEPAGPTKPPKREACTAPASLSFHQHAQNIAQMPVTGMRRAGNGMSFIGAYDTTQRPSPSYLGVAAPRKTNRPHDTADVSSKHANSTDATTFVTEKDEEKRQHGADDTKSTWQGKPNGTAYDSRLELTEEDEDLWARMAM